MRKRKQKKINRRRKRMSKIIGLLSIVCLVLVGLFIFTDGFQFNNKSSTLPSADSEETGGTTASQSSDTNDKNYTNDANNTNDADDTNATNDSNVPAKSSSDIASNVSINDNGIFSKSYSAATKLLSTMTLEEKVGQMFLARCPKKDAINIIKEIKPGGFVLFDRDFKNKTREEVTQNISDYQQASKIPMIIGVDEEGGKVVRISNYPKIIENKYLSPQELYTAGGMDAIRKDTLSKATELQQLGINLNLAPVADVSSDPKDYIYARTFGKTANKTADYIKNVVDVMKESGLSCTLKHFPGYGNNVDTHTGIAYDKRSYKSFESSDFIPFKAGIDAGAQSILVSHNIVECMDKKLPASLSSKVHKVLRDKLDFTGVIMTDDLAMDAIKLYTKGSDSSVLAVKAGNDMIIITDLMQGYNSVLAAVKKGDIDVARIDQSVLRILAWKMSMGIAIEN